MKFESQNHNNYFFHNHTGQFFQYENDRDLEEKKAFYDTLAVDEPVMKRITAQDVKHYLYAEGNGYKQLIIEVTESCNFRCRYCIYSDYYPHTRGHGKEHMPFDVMKTAIDHYFKEFSIIERVNPMKKPTISFYGGEPLIGYANIKKAVEYIDKTYPEWKVFYNITTNGLLFNDDVQEFLYSHDFAILVSLDSYEENHDRNRVTVSGSPTYKKIIDNLNRYHQKYGSKNLSISCCYDYKTDFTKLESFFNSFPFEVVSLTQVQSSRSNYFSQFSVEEKQSFIESYNKVKSKLFQMVKENNLDKSSFAYKYFSSIYANIAYHRMILEANPFLKPYTSTCIPGEKIFVDIHGNLKICEKVSYTACIGNINSGLNFEVIASFLEEYKTSIQEHCNKCPISRLCQLCFKL